MSTKHSSTACLKLTQSLYAYFIQFIDISVESTFADGMVPTLVNFNLGYYQIDQTRKKLISGTVELSGYIKPTDFANNVYTYTLNLNYQALSHTDLMIAFALPWHVYLTMYICVGFLCIFMTSIYATYHRLMSRNKKTELFFWQYIKLYFPPNFFGLLYATTPQLIYMIIIALVFSQHLMTFKLNSLWCNAEDEECMNKLLLDQFVAGSLIDSETLPGFQRRRLGYIIIHAAAWLHYRAVQLMTLRISEAERKKPATSYDNNVWSVTSWKRLNYACMNLLSVLLNVMFVYISFTNLFGDNLWFFIIGFKILSEIMESTCELLFEDSIMLSVVSSTFDLMEGLCTFGAPDFLEFIGSFVLGLGVQMGERAYTDPVVDVVGGWIVDKIGELRLWIRVLTGEIKKDDDDDDIKDEEDEEEKDADEEDEDKTEEKKLEKEESEKEDGEGEEEEEEVQIEESQDSDILITENSFNQADVEELDRIADMIFDAEESQPLRSRSTGTKRRIRSVIPITDEHFKDIISNKYL